MENQTKFDWDVRRQTYAEAVYEDILRLLQEPSSDVITVQILIAMGDLYRMKVFPRSPQMVEWKKNLTQDILEDAIICVYTPGPLGLFVYPETISLPADVDMSIFHRDRLQSFLISLTRITMHRFTLLRSGRAAMLERSRETIDAWLGQVFFSLRLGPISINAKRGDRLLVESEPPWVTYVCCMKRPINLNNDTP
ncbi:hypothetical protein IT408_04660 [Candidatus Uhrbacteria bacterium]|nr:hypothetical protein [Candidatus Uhrbacteria bacterium]